MEYAFIEDDVATLKDLGLTFVQAKIFLTLAQSSPLSVNEISKKAKIPRADLYRILKELENKGILERIISQPNCFKAIPIQECLNKLIQQRTAKSLELQKKAAQLCQDSRYKTMHQQNQIVKSGFTLLSSNRAAERTINAINSVKKGIDVVDSWPNFLQRIFFYSENIDKALQRKIKFRCIVESPKEKDDLKKIPFQRKSSTCNIKFIDFFPQIAMGIYDQKEIFIVENPNLGSKEAPVLWSDNPSLILLAEQFFNNLWIKAQDGN